MGPRSATPYELVFLPVSEIPVLERIRRLNWPDFEQFVAEAYRRQGFHVEHTGGTHPDGGYDLVLLRDKASLLVQCKHWLAYQVGVPRVRELVGAMHKVGATGAILVTTGFFTAPAKQFAIGMANRTRGRRRLDQIANADSRANRGGAGCDRRRFAGVPEVWEADGLA